MTQRKNKIPAFYWQDITIVPGTRVNVLTRHGTTGNGTVTAILGWDNVPPTICIEMDADTQYAKTAQAGWMLDEQRIPDIGLFGGEIEEVLKKN